MRCEWNLDRRWRSVTLCNEKATRRACPVCKEKP